MTSLNTSYLGLELRTPLVASAGPLTRDVDSALRLQEAGAAAIVLPSLFEEEVVHEEVQLNRALEAGGEGFPEALSYFPEVSAFQTTSDQYLASIERMKSRLDVPVILGIQTPAREKEHIALIGLNGNIATVVCVAHVNAWVRL